MVNIILFGSVALLMGTSHYYYVLDAMNGTLLFALSLLSGWTGHSYFCSIFAGFTVAKICQEGMKRKIDNMSWFLRAEWGLWFKDSDRELIKKYYQTFIKDAITLFSLYPRDITESIETLSGLYDLADRDAITALFKDITQFFSNQVTLHIQQFHHKEYLLPAITKGFLRYCAENCNPEGDTLSPETNGSKDAPPHASVIDGSEQNQENQIESNPQRNFKPATFTTRHNRAAGHRMRATSPDTRGIIGGRG